MGSRRMLKVVAIPLLLAASLVSEPLRSRSRPPMASDARRPTEELRQMDISIGR